MTRQLYTFFRSSTSYRMRIALAYKRLGYEPHYISLPKMQHREAGYRDLNPQGLVPLLVEDEQPLIQSLAIIEYLDEVYPEPGLMPKDPQERAYVRAFSQIIGCDIHPLNNVRVLKRMVPALDRGGARRSGGIRASAKPIRAIRVGKCRHDGRCLPGAANLQRQAFWLRARRVLEAQRHLRELHEAAGVHGDAAEHAARRLLTLVQASFGLKMVRPR
jgi:hypothetical protein